jgi:hypothetical protein
VTIEYRGGAESWWLVKARGSHGVFPGHAAIEDVMSQVMNEPTFVELLGRPSPIAAEGLTDVAKGAAANGGPQI